MVTYPAPPGAQDVSRWGFNRQFPLPRELEVRSMLVSAGITSQGVTNPSVSSFSHFSLT